MIKICILPIFNWSLYISKTFILVPTLSTFFKLVPQFSKVYVGKSINDLELAKNVFITVKALVISFDCLRLNSA